MSDLTPAELREYLEAEIGHYHPGRPGRIHPRDHPDGVMPLWKFSQDRLGDLLDRVDFRTKPPRWCGEVGIYQVESRAWYEWHWARGLKLRRDQFYAPRHRRHISTSLRAQVYERDGHRCLHCGTGERLSLDHIHPYSLGGEDSLENLQTLCRPCNSRKGVKV